MAKEELGLEVIISGFRQFMSQMGQMDDTTDDLASSWEGVTGDAQKAGAALAALAKGGLAVVAAGAAIAATAITAAGLAVGNLAIASAPLEGIGDAFEIMASRAGLALGDMRTAAAGTVSDFELMRIANIALTGASGELALALGEELPRLMEIARIAARATGEDVNWMFLSLVSGIKRLSPRLIDNTGILVRAVEGQKEYAAALGITTSELTAEQKQLSMLYSVLKAGEVVLGIFGEKQLTTSEHLARLSATIQNLKDRLGLALLPALVAILVPITDLAEEYGPQLLAWGEDFGKWLAEVLPPAIESAIMFLRQLLDVLSITGAFFRDTIIPVIQSVAKWFASSGTTIGGFVDTIKKFLLPALTTLAAWWAGTWPLFAEFFTKAWDSISSIAKSVLNDIVPFISERIGKIVDFIRDEFGDAVNWFTENWPLIQSTTRIVLDAIHRVIISTLEDILKIWNTVWPIIEVVLTAAWDIMLTATSATMEIMRAVIKLVMDLIHGNWKEAWGDIKDILYNILVGICGIVKILLDSILKLFGTSLEEIGAFFQHLGEGAKLIKDGILADMDDLLASLGGFVNSMVQAGVNLIMGLVTGIKSTAGILVQIIKDVISNAIAGVKKKLGISSDSKVFEGIGTNMMAGLSSSLTKWKPIIQNQINAALSSQPISTIAGGAGGGDVTNNYEYNNYLTTQSLISPGGLALEFEAMGMTTR